jgi:hypothetical protein
MECYCGHKRVDPVSGPGPGGAGAWRVVAAGLVLGLGTAAALLLRSASPAAPVPVVTTTPAAGSVPPRRPVEPAPTTTLPAAWKALAIEAPSTPPPASVPDASPTATPSPSPAVDDSIDAQRARGLADFETALAGLSARLGDFREKLRRYRAQCTGGTTQVAGCDAALQEVQEVARQIVSDIAAADEQARRSWVDPGQRRESRERIGLDEKGVAELAKAAAEAANR